MHSPGHKCDCAYTRNIKIPVHLKSYTVFFGVLFNPLSAELNPICHLLALLGAHHILRISKIRVKELNQQARKNKFSSAEWF